MSEVENETESEKSDVLVVASKVKKYIKEKSGMNTSAAVMEELTKAVKRECDKAIERAQQEHRKTVMDRDFSDRMKVNV